MYCRFLSYLNKNNTLTDQQYGFREKHSTYQAIINLIDQISAELENKNFTIGIFIDLSKAFDTLDHEILLDKLNCYGIRGLANSWFQSYLSNRKQFVDIDGTKSNMANISCGVPQGSILGPLLFLIYINAIVNVSEIATLIMFADDTNLFFKDKNLDNLINICNVELHKISNWFRLNKLSLNVRKTNFILFHTRN